MSYSNTISSCSGITPNEWMLRPPPDSNVNDSLDSPVATLLHLSVEVPAPALQGGEAPPVKRTRRTPSEHKNKEAEKRKTWGKTYYTTHKPEISKKHKAYRATHADEIRKRKQVYYATHLDEIRAQKKIYQAAHANERRKKYKIYYATHAHEISEQKKRHRAELKAAKGALEGMPPPSPVFNVPDNLDNSRDLAAKQKDDKRVRADDVPEILERVKQRRMEINAALKAFESISPPPRYINLNGNLPNPSYDPVATPPQNLSVEVPAPATLQGVEKLPAEWTRLTPSELNIRNLAAGALLTLQKDDKKVQKTREPENTDQRRKMSAILDNFLNLRDLGDNRGAAAALATISDLTKQASALSEFCKNLTHQRLYLEAVYAAKMISIPLRQCCAILNIAQTLRDRGYVESAAIVISMIPAAILEYCQNLNSQRIPLEQLSTLPPGCNVNDNLGNTSCETVTTSTQSLNIEIPPQVVANLPQKVPILTPSQLKQREHK